MPHLTFHRSAGLAGLALCVLAAAAPAFVAVIAPPALPQRVAQADAVLVGKVTLLEDKTVVATPPQPGATNKVEYQVAVVEIKEGLAGVKGLTHIKVAFLPPQDLGGGVKPPRRVPQVSLTKDQEACLFLKKHPTESFHVALNYYDILDRKTPTFARDMDLVKKAAKLLEEPEAGLKSKEADDRTLTAALLILRYRSPVPGSSKTEPIDAAQSKLILTVLAEADWLKRDPLLGQYNPQTLFFMLGPTVKDGWTPPRDVRQLPIEAKKWLKANAETYRVQRFVAGGVEK